MARTSTNKVSTLTVSGQRMSLNKFLQKNPQDPMVTSILKRNYSNKCMTEEDWFKTIDQTLNRKITS